MLTAIEGAVGPSPGETSDQLVFLTGDPETPSAIWTGTREEFVAEVETAFLIHAPVGMLIDVGRITQALTERIGETS